MTNRLSLLLLALALLAPSGCDDPMEPDAGSSPDAGPSGMDAAAPDAGGPTDAGAPLDTGPSPADSGASDRDGDGVADELDCAPDDDGVGATATRACSSACGDGEEACTDGVWGACDAPTDCACDTEGERRLVTCAMCGEQSQECTDGVWTNASECLNQGECEAAEVETRDGERCSVEQRICGSACTWGEWDYTTEPGECEAGEFECFSFAGMSVDTGCTSECVLVDNPCCPDSTDPCCDDPPTCLE